MQLKYGQWLYYILEVIIFDNINEENMESRTIVTNYSKAQKNNAFQLPKISRTALVHSESTLFDINRYQWLAQDTDYSQLTQKQIEQEYRLLRKQLLVVNDTAARSIEMFKSQNLGKKKRNISSDYHSEVMSQQIENNRSILGRLRQEFQRLQMRQKQLETNSKQTVEQMIEQTRDSIDRVKQEIKQVSTKSREINNSWQKQNKIQEQIKRLEIEKQIVQRKRHKLQMKTIEVRQNNSKLAKQLNLVQEESQFAEQVIEEQLEAQKEKIEESQMERNHRHKKHQVQALSKNIYSIETSKSLKYHGILKKTDQISNKFYRDDQKINQIEHSILITKKEISQLQEKLKYVKQNQKQQEKYVQILQEDNKNKVKDLKTQTQREGSKISRFNVQQKEKTDGFLGKLKGDKKDKSLKGRLLTISSNKNHTIEVTLQSREHKLKQIEIQTQQKPIKNHQNDKVPKFSQDVKSAKKILVEPKGIDAQAEKPKVEYELKVPAYQKLKTWNEQAEIDKLQVNKSSNKKIFNRILVDLNEVENQHSKTVKDNEKVQKSKKTENNEIEQQFVFEQQIIND